MAVTVGVMAPAIAAVGTDELELDVQGAQLLSRAELDESRGGFSIGAFKLDIGVKITTTINNALALQSVLTLNAQTKAAEITSKVMSATEAATKAAQSAAAGTIAKAGNLNIVIPSAPTAPTAPVTVASLGSDAGSLQQSNVQNGKAAEPAALPLASEAPPAGGTPTGGETTVASTVGGLVPNQTTPTGPSVPEPQAATTMPQPQLANVILDGMNGAEQASDAAVNLVEQVVGSLDLTNTAPTPPEAPELAQIVDNAGPQPIEGQGIGQIAEPPATTLEIAPPVEVPPVVIEPSTVAALAQIVSEAGPQPNQSQTLNQNQTLPEPEPQGGTQDLALNDVAALPDVIMTALAGGTKFDVGDTQVTHQIQNGILASIQNMANGISIGQTVEMSVSISNFNSVIQGALSNMKAAMLGGEIAKFSSTLGN